MKIEDVAPGQQVRAVGYPVTGADQRFEISRSDAPIMVVRDVVAHCSWFVNGMEHRGVFRAAELEVVTS